MMAAMAEQDKRVMEVFAAERARLRGFIRRRVPNEADVDDLLQEVFFELVEAQRLMKPIDFVAAWLFRVARNRITDLFRKKKPESFADHVLDDGEGNIATMEEWLVSPDGDPDSLYRRHGVMEAIEEALDELPPEQRLVFVAHELEGRSFKEMAAESGIGINTLLARKRYAVLHLRERLRDLRSE